ncbi:MAG: hypothetical protein WB780_16280, partial [Candidatus Acidiferrales bacterium]
DPYVESVSSSVGMPNYVLDAVRSMHGVKYAVPLYSGGALVKLADGNYQPVTVVGLDDTSLLGRPALLEGKIEDIYAENGFLVVRDAEFSKLENPHIGSEFELNDNRAVIVGIAQVAVSGLYGVPTLYTTYERAIQYIPNPRYTISYVLVEPQTMDDVQRIKQQVEALGYQARTKEEIMKRTEDFFIFDPYLNVITAQTILLNDQQTAVNYRMQVMVASVQLIKALGGGWNATQIPSPKEIRAQN